MTDYTQPDHDQLKPLLTKARSVRVRGGEPNPPKAAAVFDPETGDLLAGPTVVQPHARVEWSADGIEASGAGAFTTYDDLKQSWRFNARQRAEYEREQHAGGDT